MALKTTPREFNEVLMLIPILGFYFMIHRRIYQKNLAPSYAMIVIIVQLLVAFYFFAFVFYFLGNAGLMNFLNTLT